MGKYQTAFSGKTLIHLEGGKQTNIAECYDAEKAHFLAKAANAYIEPLTSDEQPEFDCLGKSQREGMPEPFVLIASDGLSPFLIALWAALKVGDTASAVVVFSDMVADPSYKYRQPDNKPNMNKIANACKIAKDMVTWREDNCLENYPVHTVA